MSWDASSRDKPGRGNGKSRRRRKRLKPAAATVIAAAITGAVSLTIAFSSGNSQGQPPTATGTANPGSTGSSGSTAQPGADVTEYADWSGGVQVYADNSGTASDLDAIPFNQAVGVSCVAKNYSGIKSINAFYLISSGPWKGAYASANEFTNGGPRESASDPSIDRRIPPCPSS